MQSSPIRSAIIVIVAILGILFTIPSFLPKDILANWPGFLPKQTVVLGLVTSKSGTLESKDALKRRIDEAAKYVSLDQLCLSPQCGFASTEEGNILAEDEQWAKLRMIVELSEEVWGK